MSNPATTLPPGFRFHPTDEELIFHYLRNRAASLPCPASIIADVDIYKFDPWDLPAKAIFGEREWYFFTPRDRKYPNGQRPNRTAVSGFWKATGTDKTITAPGPGGKESIGVKKALVFYKGKPPKGVKTGWIMHEFRLAQSNDVKPIKFRDSTMRLDDWVLCRIYTKNSHLSPIDRVPNESETVFLSSLHSNTQNDSSLKLPKSSSLSDLLDVVDYSLLSRLFDGTSDQLSHAASSQPFSNGSKSLLQQLSEGDSSLLIAQNSLRRQNWVDTYLEDVGNPRPSMKERSSGDQFDRMQNQQWLLKSHLGLHGAHL